MTSVSIEKRQPPTLLARVTHLAFEVRPWDFDSREQFSSMLEALLLDPSISVMLTVRPVCLENAPSRVGKTVGGIGDFAYLTECVANVRRSPSPLHVDEDGTRRFAPSPWPGLFESADLEQLRIQVPVCTRFGSRTGISDREVRESAERACVTAADKVRAEFEKIFSSSERVSITG